MTEFSVFMIGISIISILAAAKSSSGEGRAKKSDEEKIRDVLTRYVKTWNANNMHNWSKLFTDDVDYINRAGGWWKSNEENTRGHVAIHEMLKKQKQTMDYEASIEKISFLKPDIAVVHATWRWPGFQSLAGNPSSEFNGIMMVVMAKKDGKWLIRALQNTVSLHNH